MLRASVEHHGGEVEAETIVKGCGECGVTGAPEIFALVDAVVLRDGAEYPDARVRAELRFGRDGADRIAMVAGNFSMMNRLLDAIGAPVSGGFDALADEMGLAIPDHLHEAKRPRS